MAKASEAIRGEAKSPLCDLGWKSLALLASDVARAGRVAPTVPHSPGPSPGQIAIRTRRPDLPKRGPQAQGPDLGIKRAGMPVRDFSQRDLRRQDALDLLQPDPQLPQRAQQTRTSDGIRPER